MVKTLSKFKILNLKCEEARLGLPCSFSVLFIHAARSAWSAVTKGVFKRWQRSFRNRENPLNL